MPKSEILPKFAPHGPKRAFCAFLVEIALISRFGDDLRTVHLRTVHFTSGVAKSEILPKLAPHGPKRAFCALFIEIGLFSRFGDDLRPVRRF